MIYMLFKGLNGVFFARVMLIKFTSFPTIYQERCPLF